MKTIFIETPEHIEKSALIFNDLTRGYTKFAFYGEMGAGKTTFIKAVCKALGADDCITSPSFALINEYRLAGGEPVYHFDLYRIKDISELYDLGYEEYFYSNAYCFIEWPERAESLLPDDVVKIHITADACNARTISIEL